MHTAPSRRRSFRLLILFGAVLGTAALAGAAQAGATGSADKARGDHATSTSRARGGDVSRPLQGVRKYLDGRKGVVQVALYNNKTGRTHRRLLTGDDTQYTASIVKVDILAKWLRTYQRRGVEIPDEIPYSIRYLMQRMIQNSDNAAATSLFYFGGGCDALTEFNTLIPMRDTKVACETSTYYGWGNTTTTAADQVRLMRVFAGTPARVLGRDARNYGNQLMQGVESDQRFGITCGPWGRSCSPPDYADPDPDVTVALKNGWKTLPTCTQPVDQCPWQVNSTGWVRGKGRDYVLTVLTTRNPVGTGGLDGFNYGIDTIQNVSKRIWDNLG